MYKNVNCTHICGGGAFRQSVERSDAERKHIRADREPRAAEAARRAAHADRSGSLPRLPITLASK